jgi:hypothetical protein
VRFHERRIARLLALLLALTLVAAACGGDDDDDTASDDTTTTTEVAEEGTTTTTEAEAEVDETTTTTAAASSELAALEIYVREILRWPDATLVATAAHEYDVISPTIGNAHAVLVGDDTSGWQVDSLYTLGEGDESASVKLGYADGNNVTMGYRDDERTPDLTIAYGDGYANLFVRGGEPGGAASWPVELDPTLDNGPRRITVIWRDGQGVARRATVLPVPAGEFAAG